MDKMRFETECSGLKRLLAFLFLLALTVEPRVFAVSPLNHGIVPKWNLLERSLRSSVRYNDPFHQCELAVELISPRGETNQVFGFWDGGDVWRIRFRPDQPGRWRYRTICSDEANKRLHNQEGEFICTAIAPGKRFAQHGPVAPARNEGYFRHQDGTPFFWAADLASDAIRLSSPADWAFYCETRSRQNFTSAQWRLAHAPDQRGHLPLVSDRPNPAFFQRLDQKIEALNQAGMLSAVVLSRDTFGLEQNPDAALKAVRYAAARWQSYDVAWVLNLDNAPPKDAALLLTQFAGILNARRQPILLNIGPDWQSADLSTADWVSAVSTHDISGSSLPEKRSQSLPIIFSASALENAASPGARVTADALRSTIWQGLLRLPASGITYGAASVDRWDVTTDSDSRLPLWKKSLFLPGAKQISSLSELYGGMPFWRLKTLPSRQPVTVGTPLIAAAQTENKELTLLYLPAGPVMEFPLKTLPDVPIMTWFNPRTGQMRSAVAAIGPITVKLPTSDAQDWLLIIRDRKPN